MDYLPFASTSAALGSDFVFAAAASWTPQIDGPLLRSGCLHPDRVIAPIASRSGSVTVGVNIEQRECAEHTRQIGRRCRVQIGLVQLGETGGAKQTEAAHHLVLQQFKHP